MTKYKIQNNANELYEMINKRLKALAEVTDKGTDLDIDFTVYLHSKDSINVDRENSTDDTILAENFINTSKESIIKSLIEAEILSKKGKLIKKVVNF